MKTYKYLYRKCLDEDLIRQAYKKLRKGKTKRVEIQFIDMHLNSAVAHIKEVIEDTKPDGVKVNNPELAFKPKQKKPHYIYEHGKWRRIYMPDIFEQWLHHIIVLALEPIIVRESYIHSCGSFPTRGAHYGMKRVRKWQKSPKTKYFCKLDIRHFYDSIRYDVLKVELSRKIKDSWFLHLLFLCFKGFKKGVCLGFYLSQWLANYLLKPLDYFIKQTLKIPFYMRYMDDMVMFSPNKKVLHKAVIAVRKFIGRRFRLKIKKNHTVAKFIYTLKSGKTVGRFLDFMGFVFKRNRVVLRKTIMLKTTRLARRLFKMPRKMRRKLQAMVSYLGWFKWTDTYNVFLTSVKPFINVKQFKKIISKLDRKEKYYEQRMENRTLPVSA